MVEDGLIVEDLARGNGSLSALLDGVEEASDLLLLAGRHAALLGNLLDLGLDLLACDLVIDNEIAADGAVPALGGGDAEASLGAVDDGVARGVEVHSPGNAEIEDDAALKANERRGEIVNAERIGKLGTAEFLICNVVRILAEEVGGVARDRQRLGMSEGVENHIERVATDVAERAETARVLCDEGGLISLVADGNTATAAAARLNVVYLAEDARLNNVAHHLHILVESRLEADGEHLARLLLCSHNLDSLVECDGKGLLEKNVKSCLKCRDSAGGVLAVIGADGHGVELQGLIIDHLNAVLVVALNLGFMVNIKEFACSTSDNIRACDDLHVGLLEICIHVRECNAAGAYDTDSYLLRGIDLLYLLIFLESVKICHNSSPFLVFLYLVYSSTIFWLLQGIFVNILKKEKETARTPEGAIAPLPLCVTKLFPIREHHKKWDLSTCF